MNVLVLNSGSSSLKFQLIDLDQSRALATGLVERIGQDNACLAYKRQLEDSVEKYEETRLILDHSEALRAALACLTDPGRGVVRDASGIDAIGHRVVHGGKRFTEPARVNAEVIEDIRQTIPLAPLHNPGSLAGIETAIQLFPDTPQVAVFDTAFHQTMPPAAFTYALPRELSEKLGIRRYGFHGTSHRYVAGEAARLLGKPLSKTNIVSLHLGNGASITAVKSGRSAATSMGMTPLEGVVMGTRCGCIDPSIVNLIAREQNLAPDELDNLLTKQSGLLGLCGASDLRDVHALREQGDEQAELALEILVRSYRSYVGAYFTVLGRVDALVFTAGIGEHDAEVRARVCHKLEVLGIHLDEQANREHRDGVVDLAQSHSPVRIFVIPTNEELEIARQTVTLLGIEERFIRETRPAVQV